jgi:hypothetical protein
VTVPQTPFDSSSLCADASVDGVGSGGRPGTESPMRYLNSCFALSPTEFAASTTSVGERVGRSDSQAFTESRYDVVGAVGVDWT